MEASYSVYELLNTAAGVDSGNLEKTHLDAACIAYLEARGMVCLKRHTEAPTEEGLYVNIAKGWDTYIAPLYCQADDFAEANRSGVKLHAIGPLPEGK